MFLSDSSLSLFGSKYGSLSRLKGKGESLLGETLKSAETVGSAFGMAYSNGRFASPGKDHVEVMKDVPADLAGGVVLLGASLMGVFGEHASHADNIANGLLSAYAARVATKLGAEARLKDTSAPAVKGEFYAAYPRENVGYPQVADWAR
jgi:hypothetical protein